MTVIEASSGTYRSRVDGTLVLSIEIEPRHRDAALKLFGMPGTPLALAALKTASSKPEAEERPAIGELCRWAAIRCTEEPFQRWMTESNDWKTPANETDCATFIREVCGVESRKDLDTNPDAFDKFHRLIRQPYAAWLKANPQ